MKRILIQLTGETLDITDLQRSLKSSDWKIITESDGYYLTSDTLISITDHTEIKSKAKQFLDIVNGAANVIHGNHQRVGAGAIIVIDENGNRSIFVLLSGSITSRSRVYADLKVSGDPVNYPTTVEQWIEKAEKYESVRDALHFFNETTWWNLYKIFEIIRDDVSGQKGLNNLIDKRKLSNFTQAAQSRELLGDKARHASKKYKPPTSSLTLNEASDLIKTLFSNWIKTK